MVPNDTKLALIESARKLAVDGGLAAVTTKGVSEATGVTKGAFFHYFPTKDDLIREMFSILLDDFENNLRARLYEDNVQQGSFTRAYIGVVFDYMTGASNEVWSALTATLLQDERSHALWTDWVKRKEREFAATDGGDDLLLIRLAADGVWYARHGTSPAVAERIRSKLVEMTLALPTRADPF